MKPETVDAIISFRGVTKRFGTRVAVEDATFDVLDGRTLSIVGESGSGKSTCVRLAVGLERLSAGKILWRGESMPRGRGLKEIRRRTGVVFQDPYDSLDPRMPIGKIVGEPLAIHGIKANATGRVRDALSAVGLPDAPLASYVSRYSGGGRQRIAIARALVLEPAVLLCDEPTSSLDVSVQAQIINLLMELKQSRKIATVFVSHDLDLIRRIADDTVVMYAGRVVEAGPTQQLVERPKHPYTAALIASVPGDHPRRRKLGRKQTETLEQEAGRTGCVFAARCAYVQSPCLSSPPPLETTGSGSRIACFYPLGGIEEASRALPK